MKKLLIIMFVLLVGTLGCTSTVERPSDNPMDDTEIESEPEVSDFGDESLFDAEGSGTAIDTGDDATVEEMANESFDSGDSSSSSPEPEEKNELGMASTPADEPMPEPERELTPEPEPAPKKMAAPAKKASKDKSATRRTKSDCNMRSKPSVKGTKLTMIPKGRKIWTEPHSAKWFKVYRKKGVAYVSKACF